MGKMGSKVLHYASYEAPHEGDNCEYWSLTACGHDYDNVTHYEDSVTCKRCLRLINKEKLTPPPMQSKEITTGQMNAEIARFMGMERTRNNDDPSFEWSWEPTIASANWCFYDAPPFDRSWSWLMPVVEKIHVLKEYNPDGKNLCLMSKLTVNMKLDGYYRRCRCSILGHITHCSTLSVPHNYKQIDLPSIFIHDKLTLIEATHEAVFKFIQWLNQNKPNEQ